MDLAEFQDKDEGTIQQAYKIDNNIQAIKDNLEKGVKEMKRVAQGLCQWKDEHLWYQGKIWIPNDKGLKTSLIRKCHDDPLAGHGGTAKNYRAGQPTILLARDRRNNQTICKKL